MKGANEVEEEEEEGVGGGSRKRKNEANKTEQKSERDVSVRWQPSWRTRTGSVLVIDDSHFLPPESQLIRSLMADWTVDPRSNLLKKQYTFQSAEWDWSTLCSGLERFVLGRFFMR